MVKIKFCALAFVIGCIAPYASGEPKWQLVGSSTFSFMFWDVYQARLFNSSGVYRGVKGPLKLELLYLKDIEAEALHNATKEQWQHLGLWSQASSNWLSQLDFPSVKANESISFVLNPDQTARLLFNGQVIRVLPATQVNEHFLSIWLSAEGAYPKFTKKLKGLDRE